MAEKVLGDEREGGTLMATIIKEDEHRIQLRGQYWNDNGLNVAVVAEITKGIDWGAYIGANAADSEEEALVEVLRYGCKLYETTARHFFPGIDLPYRP